MINFGHNTSKVFSRRFHLPDESELREKDICIIDATPLDKSETIWGNWCSSFCIGNDTFYANLCEDVNLFTEKLYENAKNVNFIGDILDVYSNLIIGENLKLIGGNIGHSIFSVKKGKTVENTPILQRVFINEEHADIKLENIIISIEPQLIRKNDNDDCFYGAKFQKNIIF